MQEYKNSQQIRVRGYLRHEIIRGTVRSCGVVSATALLYETALALGWTKNISPVHHAYTTFKSHYYTVANEYDYAKVYAENCVYEDGDVYLTPAEALYLIGKFAGAIPDAVEDSSRLLSAVADTDGFDPSFKALLDDYTEKFAKR